MNGLIKSVIAKNYQKFAIQSPILGPFNCFNNGYLIAIIFIALPFICFFVFNLKIATLKTLFYFLFCTLSFKSCLICSGILLHIFRKKSVKPDYDYFLATNASKLSHYSILLPLLNENYPTLCQLTRAVIELKYPKEKKDIIFILEEKDTQTIYYIKKIIKAIKGTKINLVIVPFSLPLTKPKACNYALQFIKGDKLVIYDAEDKPHPNQLLAAEEMFLNNPLLSVIQCPLLFYNRNRNFITQCFYIEYLMWFYFTMPVLSLLKLPITLGGTSNFIKVKDLKELGNWCAYNVTEDAELGIRLKLNFKNIGFVSCVTMEEAPFEIKNWLMQRIRWIKGFNQTYFFYFFKSFKMLFQYKSGIRNLANFISFHLLYGFSAVGFLCLFCYTVLCAFMDFETDYTLDFIVISSLGTIFFCLLVCITCMIWSMKLSRSMYYSLIILGYFLLHQVAAILAIVEMIRHPFRWNKTKHSNNHLIHFKTKK